MLVVNPEVVPPGVVAPGRHGSAPAPVGADSLQGPGPAPPAHGVEGVPVKTQAVECIPVKESIIQ